MTVTKVVTPSASPLKERECKRCRGSGVHWDDSGWEYECVYCEGNGTILE